MARTGTKKAMILGWISFASGAVGGGALMVSPAGKAIAWVTWAAGWIGFSILIIGIAAMTIDILNDLVPNRIAVVVITFGQSMSMGVRANGGTLIPAIRDASNWISGIASNQVGPFFGATSMFCLAAVMIVVAWLISRRVMKGAAA